MKPIAAKALDSAARVVVVSNTPHYLYKHLRTDPSVIKLAQRSSTEKIKRMLSLYATKWSTRREAIVALYALLVGLSFKPTSEFIDFLKSFDVPCAPWARYLGGIILSKPEVATITLDHSQPEIRHDSLATTAASNSIHLDPPHLSVKNGGQR